MASFNGTAVLRDNGSNRNVQVALDLSDGCFRISFAEAADSIQSTLMEMLIASVDGNADGCVELTDVEIVTSNGLLRSERIGELLVRGRRALASEGIVTLTVIPKSSVVEFRHTPLMGGACELTFAHNSAFSGRHDCRAGGIDLQCFGEPPHLSVKSSTPLWEQRRRIGVAVSLLLGVRVAVRTGYENGVMRVNVAKGNVYQHGHRLFRESFKARGMLGDLLAFILALPEPEFGVWYKAVAFMLEGKSGLAELDIRAISLFVFLEIFDGSGSLEVDTLASMLEISRSDADLVKRTRNRLLHHADSLIEAVLRADRELRTRDKKYVLTWFKIDDEPHDAAVMFSLRLCERINAFVLRQAGSAADHYGYEEIIGSRPTV